MLRFVVHCTVLFCIVLSSIALCLFYRAFIVLYCAVLCYVLMCCVCLADLVSYFTALLVYVL